MLDAYFQTTWKDCISKPMDTIAAIVGALDNRALLQSIISHTADHHAGFGVSSSQYASFGEALIWSLEHQFGSAFTSDLRQAWIELYETVQTEMIRTAEAKSDGSAVIG